MVVPEHRLAMPKLVTVATVVNDRHPVATFLGFATISQFETSFKGGIPRSAPVASRSAIEGRYGRFSMPPRPVTTRGQVCSENQDPVFFDGYLQ